MINKSNLQMDLYGLDKFFNEIVNLINKDILPSKILFSGPKGVGKSTFAYHIINYIFSKNETNSYNLLNKRINDENRSFKLILNKSHPNFHLIDLIDEKKNIEIEQIRNMINYTNKSSFNNLPKIILIDNIESLNINSSNALLKIIEEPNKKCFFFLIYNSNRKIISTLKSRCLLYKINLSYYESIDITNKIINNNIFHLINEDLVNQYFTPGDFLSLLKFANLNKINLKDFNLKSFLIYLIKNNFYKKDKFIKLNIFNFIESYFLKLFSNSNNKSYIINVYSKFIQKYNNMYKFNLDPDSYFLEFKSKILNE
tara:strand:- start:748 stop:1686 length:939 start_codon:yes stop_codon:yes gene_type:complete